MGIGTCVGWKSALLRCGIYAVAVTALVACGGAADPAGDANSPALAQALTITRADWDPVNLLLTVTGSVGAGVSAGTVSQLTVADADTAESLASVPVAAGQTAYAAVVDDLTSVPCAIAVAVGGTGTVRRAVANAPANCQDFAPARDLRLNVRRAVWGRERSSLNIIGVASVPNTVEISYAGTNKALATVPVNDRLGRTLGSWRLHIVGYDPAQVPCAVNVTTGAETEVFAVDGAPANCVGTPTTPPPAANQAPTGSIGAPAGPVTIAAGESVSFAGSGTDPDNNLPLTYAWDFGGGAAVSTQQNPGPVVFATAGIYTAKLTVTDSLGLSDPNPPTRVITVTAVTPPPPPPTAQPPSGTIIEPAADVTVAAGASVTFSASGTDPGGLALSYRWHFGGGAPESALQNPGAVVFATPGIYPVELTATNSAGIDDPTPETRTVTVTAAQAKSVVVGAALSGMTTPDKDFSVASWVPLGNSLRAQVVEGNMAPTDKPTLATNAAVKLEYAAQADAKTSITTTSVGKTNFWPIVNTEFSFVLPTGVTLQNDQGLRGTNAGSVSHSMPGTGNTPQAFGYFNAAGATNTFTATAIPVVPVDDANQANNYPLFRVSAADTANTHLAHLDTVLAVGNEMDCATGCHATGGVAADAAEAARLGGGITWSTNPDVANQAKDNIWIIHDSLHGTPPTGTTQDTCSRCHYTPSADPDGLGPQGTQQQRRPWLPMALHRLHGLGIAQAAPSATTPPVMTDDQCGRCHESGGAKFSRGAMLTAGQTCEDCHGGLLALGAQFELKTTPARVRAAYADQPRCESCHIGDALTVTAGPLVLRQAFDATDPAATPRLMPTSRYAQEPGKTFAASVGHGKVACIGCHGSTHAEWPVNDAAANDNEAPVHLQGHRGVLTECKVCHVGGLDVTLQNGPHGLHAINDPGWNAQHGPVYTADPNACKACHGTTLDGGYLSRAATDRSFEKEDGTPIAYKTGDPVGCADCHAKPQ